MSKNKKTRKELSPQQRHALLTTLKARFETNMKRHKGLEWTKLQAKLEANPGKLWSLNEMELTGGEPDVVGYNKKTGEYIFYDCSPRVRKNAGVFAMTAKRWQRAKKTSRKTARLIWRRLWASSF